MGSAVFESLYREQVRPLGVNGPKAMPGVFWRGHRVMALDGSTLDLADEAGNAERFGYPGVSRGQAACPMLRFCALVECGTGVRVIEYRVSAAQAGAGTGTDAPQRYRLITHPSARSGVRSGCRVIPLPHQSIRISMV